MHASLVLAWVLAPGASSPAVDFIRGDTNGDGVVTPADAAFLAASFFFQGPKYLPCEASGDFDDDERMDVSDARRIFLYTTIGPGDPEGSGPPAAPFPDPGPDTTATPDGYKLPCDAYGGGFTVDDPAAKLQVLDAVAEGGLDSHATITVRLSSSVPLWGYSGTIRIGGGVAEDAVYAFKDRIGITALLDPEGSEGRPTSQVGGSLVDGKLRFGYITTWSDPVWLAPGAGVPAVSIRFCLKPGIPAGQYPLAFEDGELIHAWSQDMEEKSDARAGRRIVPALASGTLRVLRDVSPGLTCEVRPPTGGLRAELRLTGATAPPGGTAVVELSIEANRACQGFGFRLTFDPQVLQIGSIAKLYPDEAGPGYPEVDNATGSVRGFARFGFDEDDFFLPAYQQNPVFAFHFRVNPDTDAAATEVRFADDPEGPQWNFFKSFADTYTPETADSFVFVNGLVSVLPDGILFIRGDSNGDLAVDLSDAQSTLSYLFLGGRKPHCYDAADANDDGTIDVSDPIATLQFLFLGEAAPPPPSGEEGPDPTPDGLGCYYRS
ncbi:MAG: hypothetical protein HY721_01095 [Planctomycetes bacterium]|nr:hypothetical protein [Planctomycetota bacterium]